MRKKSLALKSASAETFNVAQHLLKSDENGLKSKNYTRNREYECTVVTWGRVGIFSSAFLKLDC